MAAARMQREWQIEDRDEERAYNRVQLDETRDYSRQVYSQLVEDAQAAGFNPLTALRNGGGSSYNSGAAHAPLSATPLSRQAPVKQAVGGSAIGDAFTRAGDFISNFDPFADQKREQEYRLVESQISALNASALSGVPRGGGSFASGSVERRPSGQSGALGKPTKWEVGDVSVTNPFKVIDVANVSDAAALEQRYGEPGSWLGGVRNIIVDGVYAGYQGARWAAGKAYQSARPFVNVRSLTKSEMKGKSESKLPAWIPRVRWTETKKSSLGSGGGW